MLILFQFIKIEKIEYLKICYVYKKVNEELQNNYRRISDIPSTGGVFGRIRKKKIEPKTEELNKPRGWFRSGQSCLDNSLAVRQII